MTGPIAKVRVRVRLLLGTGRQRIGWHYHVRLEAMIPQIIAELCTREFDNLNS